MTLGPSGLIFQSNERIIDWKFMSFMMRIPFRTRVEHAGIGYKVISSPVGNMTLLKNCVFLYVCLYTDTEG